MGQMPAERNLRIDMLRGIAILLVFLGHTISGCTVEGTNNVLFNIIWSLQMPLFILISGYVTCYSKPLNNRYVLFQYIFKRTVAYMIPWVVWTLVVRGLVLGDHNYLNLRWILWHMDSGYWFLFSIWTISMIFGITQYVTSKVISPSKKLCEFIFHALFYIGCMGGLLCVGLLTSFSFLCIKLTLYYMPFYYLGYLYARYKNVLLPSKVSVVVSDVLIAVSLFIYIFFIVNFRLYDLSDALRDVIIRVVSSLCGCIAVCGLVYKTNERYQLIGDGLVWCGSHSLELYVFHHMALNIVMMADKPMFMTPQGLLLTAVNFCLTLVISIFVISILHHSTILKLLLFGKYFSKPKQEDRKEE